VAEKNNGIAKGETTPFGKPADRTKAKRKTMMVSQGGVTVLGKYKDTGNSKNKKTGK